MLMFAPLTIACLGLSPQGGGAPQDPPALLGPAEQKSLQQKLAKLFAANSDANAEGNDRAREKAQKAYLQAKRDFMTEWEARTEKKGNLLKSMGDLQAIFANCITYDRRNPLTLRRIEAKEEIPAHYLSVPKNYKAENPTRTVLMLPGLDEKNEWTDGKKWFDLTWTDKCASAADVIFHAPVVPKDIELDPLPDYSRDEGERQERDRIQQLLKSFGETQRLYNVDRGTLVLDAGKGACGFALRAATHFPDRFAGLVLRDPVAVDEIRLGSLSGLSILLLSTAANADVCKALKARLDKVDPNDCTILATTDEYPFKAATPDIEKWMAGVHRVVNRAKVVLEPNDDRFKKGYWVEIRTMDSIHTAPPDRKPRVEVEADRAQNRISIKAVGIERLGLQLNDALVDLDKDVTIVVNDKAVTEKRSRDFNRMFDFVVLRFDSDFLFPVQFDVQVPKSEAKAADAGGDK